MCSSVRLTCKEVLGFLRFTIGALIITYTTLGLPYYKGIGLLRFSGFGVSQDPPMGPLVESLWSSTVGSQGILEGSWGIQED